MGTLTRRHTKPAASEETEPIKAETDRVTVALTAKVARQLARLRLATGLSKTDLINRALSLYDLTERELANGHELAFYDPDTKEYQRVHIA